MNRPTICIVGRPNVGKSRLFNRMMGRSQALVHNVAGVTRDCLEGELNLWSGREERSFQLIDTGGLGEGPFKEEISRQVREAVRRADGLILVFDGPAGITAEDREVVRELRVFAGEKPIFSVVNKLDIPDHDDLQTEFFEFGFEALYPVSAEHDRGLEDLKAALVETLVGGEVGTPNRESLPKVAIVGKPNVGKSTFLNTLLGYQRAVTSPIAGTTVDNVDAMVEVGGERFEIVDTAGVRRKNKTEKGVEVLSVMMTKRALAKADVAILLIDAEVGISDQDEKIAGLILDAGCGVIIAVNKWDLQRGNKDFDQKEAESQLRKAMGFLNYAPVYFMSALENKGCQKVAPLLKRILSERKTSIATPDLTRFIQRQAEVHNPKNARIYYCHQTGHHPPSFVVHVNEPKKIGFSLERHLVNSLRKNWKFYGNPIRMKFLKRTSQYDSRH